MTTMNVKCVLMKARFMLEDVSVWNSSVFAFYNYNPPAKNEPALWLWLVEGYITGAIEKINGDDEYDSYSDPMTKEIMDLIESVLNSKDGGNLVVSTNNADETEMTRRYLLALLDRSIASVPT